MPACASAVPVAKTAWPLEVFASTTVLRVTPLALPAETISSRPACGRTQ